MAKRFDMRHWTNVTRDFYGHEARRILPEGFIFLMNANFSFEHDGPVVTMCVQDCWSGERALKTITAFERFMDSAARDLAELRDQIMARYLP